MKKLFLLLLLSLSFVGSVNAHSGRTDSNGGHNDYSNGTYHYHNSTNTYEMYDDFYDPDNPCGVMAIFDYNEDLPGYSPCPGIYAYEAGYGLVSALGQLAGFQVQEEEGSVINDISNAIAEGIANEKASKAISSPPNSYRSAGGALKCINGYYKTGNACKKIPENAHSSSYGLDFICNTGYVKDGNPYQEVCIQKKEDKPKVVDKTTTSTLKSESKTTKKQTTLGFSGLSDLLGFLLLLTFLGLVFWRIFKPLKRLYKKLTRRRK